MKEWPDYDGNGDLPAGVHQATLTEVIAHFGQGDFQRARVAQRLARIYDLAQSTIVLRIRHQPEKLSTQ